MTLSEKKAAVRQQLLNTRNALTEEQRREKDKLIYEKLLSLPQLHSAKVIFCFISNGTEVDTHALLTELLRQNKQILVPKILSSREMIAVPFINWEELEPGQLGILTPKSSAAHTEPVDVCITPGVGFTSNGKRLGYGKGYYDQWFSKHPLEHRIAVAYECQLLPDIPTDKQDILITTLVTERKIIDLMHNN